MNNLRVKAVNPRERIISMLSAINVYEQILQEAI